jgi:hypothetical protein
MTAGIPRLDGKSGHFYFGETGHFNIGTTSAPPVLGIGPLKAAMVPPMNHCPGSHSMAITFQRPVLRKTTSALPKPASTGPALDFWRRFPSHSTG